MKMSQYNKCLQILQQLKINFPKYTLGQHLSTVLDEYKNQHFSPENKEAQQYFEKVILVFLTRIVELHILPNLYQPKYKELKKLLSEKGYWHLSKTIAEKYPYFDTSFSKMARHQKKLIFKTKVYQLLQKIKKL